ncbi:MAG TPA: helicase [Kiritimatiellae bacterium]|nr:helicase [Kiritimatiellia bacterium]
MGQGTLEEQVRDFFGPDGPLARATSQTGAGIISYEYRLQQVQMAEAVARILFDGGHLAVEAGTGVGKSLAYLVPCLFFAEAAEENRPVVISTYTISLQEQLLGKDIPLLQAAAGRKVPAVLAKGRNNYLCLRRLSAAMRAQHDLLPQMRHGELHRINERVDSAQEGSRQELPFIPSAEVWELVCCEQDNCLGQKCRFYERCFFVKARRRLAAADLIIVNHHLFFADLALSIRARGILPRYSAAILDEAHQIPRVAPDYFGLRISQAALEYWAGRLLSKDEKRGLLVTLREADLVPEIRAWRSALDRLFREITEELKLSPERTHVRLMSPMRVENAVSDPLAQMSRKLAKLAGRLDTIAPEMAVELRALALRGQEMALSLEHFFNMGLDDYVYWVELEGVRKDLPVLHALPIEVGPILQQELFGRLERVILSSATLSVAGRMDYFCRRLGADCMEKLIIGSPFRYEQQMQVIVIRGLPDPSDENVFTRKAACALRPLLLSEKGGVFVLFTSSRMMHQFAELLAEDIRRNGRTVHVQGQEIGRDVMLQRFRTDGNAILFGLDSFWMGVDVQGPALRMVVIVRLPFAVPDQPPVRALMDRIHERGGDPFMEFALPEAVLKFRQGVGRLIRSAYDEGRVVILDGRIVDRRYGRYFLQSLPECRIEIRQATDLDYPTEGVTG